MCPPNTPALVGMADQYDILHVDVVDPVAEPPDELDVVHALVAHVARIVVEAEPRVAVDASTARSVEAMSKAISVGWTSRANHTSSCSNTSRIG